MLEKTTNTVGEIGIIGQVCVESPPPPVPPPSPPSFPPPTPPVVGQPPTAPPSGPPAVPVVSTYQDSNGDCWRVINWVGGTSGLVPTIEKIPIDCSEL